MIIYLISISVAFLLGILYLFLIRFFIIQWEILPAWEVPEDFMPQTSVTVLLPVRNEAHNIVSCLSLLLSQQYPSKLFEVIVINDHSEDATLTQVNTLHHPGLRVFSLPDEFHGKKAALAYGIERATGELILSTDADCRVPKDWLAYHVSFFQTENTAFTAAPVQFQREKSALERFQSLDMLGTMIITGAGIYSGLIHLSNGANLAYPKSVFESVGGFSGIDRLASGDDMLLMHKIVEAFPGKIGFIKNRMASVKTEAERSWSLFFQQRLRWATKSGSYQDRRVIVVLAMVFLLCWSILLSPLLILFWGWPGLIPFLILLCFKMGADYRLLKRACEFFDRSDLLQHFFISQILHTVYIALIGLLANIFKKYEWKGRRLQ